MTEEKLQAHRDKYNKLMAEYDATMDELERRRIQHDLNNIQMVLDYYEKKQAS